MKKRKILNKVIVLDNGSILKIVSKTGEYFYVMCENGNLIIKEKL